MKAAWYEEAGAARAVLTVGEMPRPEPGPGEVLVRVHVSGVNPSDTKTRAGKGRGPIPGRASCRIRMAPAWSRPWGRGAARPHRPARLAL
ncbi:hypothetical protein ACFQU7_14035 [Pseudoroseomonas wenyumeiae]